MIVPDIDRLTRVVRANGAHQDELRRLNYALVRQIRMIDMKKPVEESGAVAQCGEHHYRLECEFILACGCR